jgi:hypothetical protein
MSFRTILMVFLVLPISTFSIPAWPQTTGNSGSATTLFSNFGPGDSYQSSTGTAWAMGNSDDASNAVSFVYSGAAPVELGQFRFAANWFSGTNILNVGFWGGSTDLNSATLLESFTFSANAFRVPQIFTAVSKVRPVLLPGKTYFITQSVPDAPNTVWGWQWNDQGQNGFLARFGTGFWFAETVVTPVFDISGPAATFPLSTITYYVRGADGKTLHDQGALLAQAQIATGTAQDNAVALLFGAPTFDPINQAYGASGWGHPRTLVDIASLAQDFIIGYYNALGTQTNLHVRLILATSNSGPNVTFNHGDAWAQMVQGMASWVISQGYVAQVDIAGGINIELLFNSFSATSNWVNGYTFVTPNRYLYDLGAAEGCPPTGSCANKWTQENLWFVSWGAVPSLPLPEIYNEANAKQWQNLSLYGFQHHNQNIIISGALTEQGACSQIPNDPTCKPTPFSPAQGWQSLSNVLNGDPATAQILRWSTDIRWLDKEQ